MPYTWTFEQLGGDDPKTLTLKGYAAPFGRPRQKPLLKEVIKSRVQTTKYPGSKRPPTRSAFGVDWEDMEISGRWMTKMMPGETANVVAQLWSEFVRDEQLVRMAWGWVTSYVVFIEELELARESEHEIAWRMKLLVDKRDDVFVQKPVVIRDDVSTFVDDIFAFVKASKREPLLDESLAGDFLDSLDALAGDLNSFSAQLNKLAGEYGDLEKATFSTIAHFRGAIAGIKEAAITFRDAAVNAGIDTVVVVRSAQADIAWAKYQASLDTETNDLLSLLSELDRKAELIAKSDTSKVITAVGGDTWESLSTRATGGPDSAGAIRQANGARFGELPEPGVTYLVP